jgi:hypothetical protein
VLVALVVFVVVISGGAVFGGNTDEAWHAGDVDVEPDEDLIVIVMVDVDMYPDEDEDGGVVVPVESSNR